MKKLIFLVISLMIIGCGVDVPDDQQTFTDEWQNFTDNHEDAGTKAQKTLWFSRGTTHIDQKLAVKDWYGEVIEVGSNYITVNYDGIKYYLYPKGKGIDFTIIDQDMELLFSGILNGNYFWDTLAEPGLYVDCTKITNDDQSVSYFVITDSELQKYQDEVALDKELGEAWEDLKDIFQEGVDEFTKELKEIEFE